MEKSEDLIITLDNGCRYALVDYLIYENKRYAYLCNIDNFADIKIGEIDADNFIVVESPELLGKLIIEFAKLIQLKEEE